MRDPDMPVYLATIGDSSRIATHPRGGTMPLLVHAWTGAEAIEVVYAWIVKVGGQRHADDCRPSIHVEPCATIE